MAYALSARIVAAKSFDPLPQLLVAATFHGGNMRDIRGVACSFADQRGLTMEATEVEAIRPHAAPRHSLVFVQPSVQQRWEVVLEGHVKSHQFADRSLALRYAKMWAAVNRPSTVRVSDAGGSSNHEWIFT